MSLTSRRTGSALLAAFDFVPFGVEVQFVPFEAGRLARSSMRLFLDAGSGLEVGTRLQTWREIWLNSST